MKRLGILHLKWILGAVGLGLAACGGDSTGPGSGGFDATLTGATSGTVTGLAVFGPDAAAGDFVFELYSGDTDPVTVIRFRRTGTARPSPGEYAVGTTAGDSTFAVVFLQEAGFQTTADMDGQEGTVTITEVTESEIRADFSFRAEGYLVVNGGAIPNAVITVGGSFRAVPAEG